jgi:hypothetical protein
VDRNNPALAAQRDQKDPDYKTARIAADRAALATQRSALMELERARTAGALSAEQQRELDSRIEALRGRVAKPHNHVAHGEYLEVDPDEVRLWVEMVLEMCQVLRDALGNAAATESWRRYLATKGAA